MRKTVIMQALAAALSCAAPLAQAAWQPLVQDGTRRVEVDPARAEAAGGRPTLWSRLTLSSPAVDPISGRSFAAVEMLSRFDCEGRKVATLQRIYRDENGVALRDERLVSPRESAVEAGADERLFGMACRESLASQTEMKARVGHADYNNAVSGHLMAASDEHAEKPEKGAEKPPEKLPGAPEKLPQPIRKPINPEQLPAQIKRQVVNPEHIPPVHKKAEKAEKPEKAEAPEHEAEVVPPPRRKVHKARPARKVEKSETSEKAAAEHAAEHKPHWSYEGETGPAAWGKLSAANASCESGTRQSPIDIREGVKVDLPEIRFDYKPSLFRVVDNGHTIQVNYGEGSSLTVQGNRYELVQFHFHKPSEEHINGRTYDMVVHLVHKDDEGHLAVVSVLLEKGKDNPFIQTIWNNLPLEQNAEVSPPDVAIDLGKLLPDNHNYFTYMGSLTTPPCTEGVLWMVLKTPVQISPEQVAVFSRLYRNNARPIQKNQGRLIKESR